MSDKFPGGIISAGAPAGFSVALNGSSYLSVADNAALEVGSSDFTVEAWVYLISNQANGSAVISKAASSSYSPFMLALSGAGYMNFYCSSSGSAWNATTGDPTIFPTNTWVHVAGVRSGNTFTLYRNGVAVGTPATLSGALWNNTESLLVGWINYASAYWNGYISNARLVIGTALYTAAFTPPTQLFPVTNTALLTCQSPTFIDNSTNAFTITQNGTPTVSNFTPFAAYQGFNPALGAAAGGVWTIDEAAYYQNNRLWPIYDPYFNQTTLMLHGNGTNAAQNNTFLDSSTNNFTITRNGNTTQGSFSPFSQTGWSNYGSGLTTEGLVSATSSQYSFGTGDWCLEFWFYRSGNGPSSGFLETFIDMRDADVQGNGICAGTRNDGSIWLYDAQVTTPAGTFSSNTWNHFVYSRQNGVIKLFINGAMRYSGAYTNNYTSTNCRILRSFASGYGFNGYMSNVRIIKGNVPAQYQGTGFAVPTAPLTAVTGTSLLTCQSNQFIDNSANNFLLTPSVTPSVQAFSPFVPAYITPTTYSNWFDGSGDYLQIASATALQLNTSVAWTIEAWVYPTTLSGDNGIIAKRSGGSTEWQFSHSSSSGLTLYTGATTYFSGQTLTVNKFQHVAITWDLTTLRFFIDGVQTPTTNTGISLPASNTYPVNIASNTAGGETWYGCISNLRLVKGTALYTASFTPPTAPLTNITNTSLLTCQSSTFIDNSSNAFTITAAGNTLPVTSPTPFPAKVDTTTLNSAYSTSLIGGAAYFDGTDDCLVSASTTAFNLGTGDFCIEMWFYWTGSGNGYFGLCGSQTDYKIAASLYNQKIMYGLSSTGSSWNVLGAETSVGSNTIKPNSWTHFVYCRTGNTISAYVNGARDITISSSASVIARTEGYVVGSWFSTLYRFLGYISNFRFIVGSNPYNANSTGFAPPVLPQTAVTNTQLLTNFTNGAIFDNTAKNVLETVGNAQISTTQSKWGGSSMYFDGSGDYLQVQSNVAPANFNMGTGDYTVEFWMYSGTPGSQQCLFDFRNADVAGQGIAINYRTDRTLAVYMQADRITSSALTANTWTHVAVVRASGTYRLYVNGVSASGTWANSDVVVPPANRPIIGAVNNGTQEFLGYIDDLRVTKGVARYLTNFTPPTSQLQDQ